MAESRGKKLLLILLIKRRQLELDELEMYLCMKLPKKEHLGSEKFLWSESKKANSIFWYNKQRW